MELEVDASLRDLHENMDTETALQAISLHVQKAADNVHKLPSIGERVGTIIVSKCGRWFTAYSKLCKSIGERVGTIIVSKCARWFTAYSKLCKTTRVSCNKNKKYSVFLIKF